MEHFTFLPNEIGLSIAQIIKHSLFVLFNLYKDSNSKTILKALINDLRSSKTFHILALHLTLCRKYCTDACVTLKACTAPGAFVLYRVLHILFPIDLFKIMIGKVRISPEIPSSALFVTQCAKHGRYLPYLAHWVTTMYCVGDAWNRERSTHNRKSLI